MNSLDLLRFFDPLEVLTPEDPRYIELEAVTSGRAILRRAVRVVMGATNPRSLQVVSGLPGSGKSTLLNGLQQAFDSSDNRRTLVLRRDLSNRVEIGGLPQAGELLGLAIAELALALAEGGLADSEAAGIPMSAQGLPTLVQVFFQSIDPESKELIQSSLTPKALREKLEPHASYTARLRDIDPTTIQEGLIPRARAAVQQLAQALCAIRGKDRLVFILDGIEKAIPKGILSDDEADRFHDEAAILYETWIPTFALPCHLVITAPPGLFSADRLGRYQGSYFVSMAKVRDQARHPHEPGEQLLLELIRRRHPEAMRLLFGANDAMALKLVRLTGGFVRDLIRLIAEAILSNVDEESPIPNGIWIDVIDRYTYEVRARVSTDPFWVLRDVDRNPEHRRMMNFRDKDRRVLWRMLDKGVLLGYQNGELWCDLHPAFRGDIRLEDGFALPPRDGEDKKDVQNADPHNPD